MFVSPAYAQAAAAPGGGSGLEAMLPLILILGVFYFLMVRPQQKKHREKEAMLGAIRRGDRIVTGGGIIGTVTKVVNDKELAVEISDGVKVRVQRALVSAVVSKTEPVKGKGGNSDGDSGDGGEGSQTVAGGLKNLFGNKDN